MSGTVRILLAAGTVAALLLEPSALRAQSSSVHAADSLAYPRQYVNWVFTTHGDSVFAHAGPELREKMKSAESVNEMAGRIATRFGEAKGTETEVQFDEGPLKVYIAVMHFAQETEPGAWTVVYSPSTKVVERASFSPVSVVKAKYPQAKLP